MKLSALVMLISANISSTLDHPLALVPPTVGLPCGGLGNSILLIMKSSVIYEILGPQIITNQICEHESNRKSDRQSDRKGRSEEPTLAPPASNEFESSLTFTSTAAIGLLNSSGEGVF